MMTNEETSQLEDRIFWKSVLGRFKGYAAGAFIGVALGVLAGGAAVLATNITSVVGMTTGGFLGATALLGAAGMGMVAHAFSDIGQLSAAVANGVKELENHSEARERELLRLTGMEEAIPELDRASKVHASVENKIFEKNKGPHIHWDASLIGAAFGAAAGGLFLASGYVVPSDAVPAVLDTAQVLKSPITLGLPGAAGMAACVGATSLIGASFGFGGRNFKAIKKYTDGLFEGKLLGGVTARGHDTQPEVRLTPKTPEHVVHVANLSNFNDNSNDVSYRQLLADQAAQALQNPAVTR